MYIYIYVCMYIYVYIGWGFSQVVEEAGVARVAHRHPVHCIPLHCVALRCALGFESGPLSAVHLSRHKWPGGLVD